MDERIWFFGCWSRERLGHYLYAPGGTTDYGDAPLSVERLDAAFAPADPAEDETKTLLTIYRGLTILAMWDRSADIRRGSNAAFVTVGEHPENEMWRLAYQAFPEQTRRLAAWKAR